MTASNLRTDHRLAVKVDLATVRSGPDHGTLQRWREVTRLNRSSSAR